MLQRFGDLHNAINRLEGSIRNSPLEGILTQQYEMIQFAQFALEFKVHEIREVLNAITREQASTQSYFRSTPSWLTNSIPHIATGIGVGVGVGRYMPTSEVVTPSLAKISEKQEFDYQATPSQTPKPKHQGTLRRDQADIEQRRLRNIPQSENEQEDGGTKREKAQRAMAGGAFQPNPTKHQTESDSPHIIGVNRDYWVCCQCNSLNSSGICPCSHSICYLCQSDREFEAKQREPMWRWHRCGRGPYLTCTTPACLSCEYPRCCSCHSDEGH